MKLWDWLNEKSADQLAEELVARLPETHPLSISRAKNERHIPGITCPWVWTVSAGDYILGTGCTILTAIDHARAGVDAAAIAWRASGEEKS